MSTVTVSLAERKGPEPIHPINIFTCFYWNPMLNVENKVLWLIDGVRFRYCAETLIKTNSDSNFDSPRPIIPRTLQSPYNAHLGSQALTHDVTATSTFRHSSLPIYITSLQSFGFRRYFRTDCTFTTTSQGCR